MNYFCVCTFDLNQGASSEDYKNAYSDLENMGFKMKVRLTAGEEILLPNTTTAGTFNGDSAGAVRDDLTKKVKTAFANRGFKSEIFISVGGNWAWGHETT